MDEKQQNIVRKAVMKRAHRLYESSKRIAAVFGKALFSECLKEAWKEATCCPLCGQKNPNIGMALVMTCPHCRAIHTPLGRKRPSISVIINYFVDLEHFHTGNSENQAYFDIFYKEGNQIRRTHGWYHLQSRRVTQFG